MRLVYGPSARGALRKFATRVDGILLTDLPKPVGLDWKQFSLSVLDAAAQAGMEICFDLTQVQNLSGILSGIGEYIDTVTAAELRYIRQHWDTFEHIVQFYEHDVKKAAPWK